MSIGGPQRLVQAPTPPPLAGWAEGRSSTTGSAWTTDGATAAMLSTALRRGGLVDTRSIQLAGSMIVLPRGERLLRRYRAAVRTELEAIAYEEHDFPLLAPSTTYDPIDALFPLAGRLMAVGDDDDWSTGRPRAVLQPSGEATVSSYLRARVRTERDLPLRILRHTRYVRPAPRGHRSGRGIFRSMESGDVFETHACVAPERSADELASIVGALARLCRWARVPVTVLDRPL